MSDARPGVNGEEEEGGGVRGILLDVSLKDVLRILKFAGDSDLGNNLFILLNLTLI